jgi:hypothetical protein
MAMTETALGELLSKDLSGLDVAALMVDGCISPRPAVSPWASTSRHQAPVGAGGGFPRERHRGHRPAGRPARTRPRCEPPDTGGYRRVQGGAPRVDDVLERPVIQRCQIHYGEREIMWSRRECDRGGAAQDQRPRRKPTRSSKIAAPRNAAFSRLSSFSPAIPPSWYWGVCRHRPRLGVPTCTVSPCRHRPAGQPRPSQPTPTRADR